VKQCKEITPWAMTLDLQIVLFRGAIIEKEHGGFSPGEELFELQDLASIPEGRFRQQPHFREGIENDAHRVHSARSPREALA
jgi:hypothetical protein